MILTPQIERDLIAQITAAPASPVVLPEWAYGKSGRVVVLVDGLPIDLHRHLHNVIIRPLGYHERMHRNFGRKNVNPYLFTVVEGHKSPRTHCNKGHAYEGNEAPPNSRGYRCRTCLRDSYGLSGTGNSTKTHCPSNHEYTTENTTIGRDGKRRCLTCKRARNAAYMRTLRALSRKENP